MEAVQGCTKTVTFQTELTCDACSTFVICLYFTLDGRDCFLVYSFSFCIIIGGSGVPPGVKPDKCNRCKGSGMVSFVGNKLFTANMCNYFLPCLHNHYAGNMLSVYNYYRTPKFIQ